MSKHYAAPEEILYHVGFSAQQLQGATVAVLPGDPGRVEPLAKALGSDASFIASHREYTSWLTKINDAPVLVCSTGMGGPSVAICLEELARMGIKKLIRFGTTGTIQEKVNLGDIIIDKAAIRLDGTSQHYAPLEFPAVASFEVTTALVLQPRMSVLPIIWVLQPPATPSGRDRSVTTASPAMYRAASAGRCRNGRRWAC